MAERTTYKDGRPLPPRHEWRPRIFIRGDKFYTIDLPPDDDLDEHVKCNPGTTRIEDVFGNVLWPKETKQ